MGCSSCNKRKVSSVVYTVSGGDLEAPEVFDSGITPDAGDMARARAAASGGKIRTSRATRTESRRR